VFHAHVDAQLLRPIALVRKRELARQSEIQRNRVDAEKIDSPTRKTEYPNDNDRPKYVSAETHPTTYRRQAEHLE
jgi:hypothetical protein